MEKKDFKFIVGQVKANEKAVIRIFDAIDHWTAYSFIDEFNWLQNYIKPSEIEIHINSTGGSVIDGMSIYSMISNCQIKTTCINEGLAASMGSIIWAAGDESKMRDYATLMIHNPFIADDVIDKDDEKLIECCTNQLKTIYMNRWGFDEDKVKEIMDGEEGIDGTWFTATSAVEAGIIPESSVIRTTKQLNAKAQKIAACADIKDRAEKYKELALASFNSKDTKQSTFKQNVDNNSNNNNMENKTLDVALICAALGMSKESAPEDVIASLPKMVEAAKNIESVKAKLKEKEDEVQALTLAKTSVEASLTKANDELSKVNAVVAEYKKKEAEVAEKAIEAMIDKAITEGRIQPEAKASWVDMAKANLELAKSTLASIPAQVDLSKSINQDEETIKGAANTAVKEAEAKINATIGEKFEFVKL